MAADDTRKKRPEGGFCDLWAKGLTRSTAWLPLAALLFVFVGDFLRPLPIPIAGLTFVFGWVLFVVFWLGFHRLKRWVLAVASLFCLMAVFFSVAVFAALVIEDVPPEGVLAFNVPQIGKLQKSIGVVEPAKSWARHEVLFLNMRADMANERSEHGLAAHYYGRASEVIAPYDKYAAWRYALLGADAYQKQSKKSGDVAALRKAVALCRTALAMVPRDRAPLDWARTQERLGNALLLLSRSGKNDGTPHDSVRVNEAIVAFRKALTVYTRADNPRSWANTQKMLGSALLFSSLPKNGGTSVDGMPLNEAIVAFRAALTVYTRADDPKTWASIELALGTALFVSGIQTDDSAPLREAVIAYREALKVFTRERTLLDWINIQRELGNALATLGAREGGIASLNEAIAAYRAALNGLWDVNRQTPEKDYMIKEVTQKLDQAKLLLLAHQKVRGEMPFRHRT